jgi:transcriptional regulator with XRE-family HTH domain
MTTKEKFGQNLKKVRNGANLTQKQIADKAGIHVNYYARVERGEENPSFEVLERIIKALKIKSSEVMPF